MRSTNWTQRRDSIGLDGEVGGIISPADIEYAAAALEPNSSAALLIWEDVWAARFVEAVRNADGVLLEGARIPHELIAPRWRIFRTAV